MEASKDSMSELASAISPEKEVKDDATTPETAPQSSTTDTAVLVADDPHYHAGESSKKTPSTAASLETVREEVDKWIKERRFAEESEKLRILLKDYDALKDKVGKLKSLLGRSAKAQREAKVDLEATQKRLDQALREIERLNKKIDKLANRPTHMELLADFETNFDRALLSVGQQTGGQDTAPPGGPTEEKDHSAVVDSLLMQELNESKQRIEKLENLNAALLHRSSLLEAEARERKHERDELASKISRLDLEKRMAVMEAEQATKALQQKSASLEEMQLEIDLLTKASVNANARAAQGEELIKTAKTDREHVQELEAKVQALQEWALASSEAKNLAQERVRLLENQLRTLQQGSSMISDVSDDSERILFAKHGSLVVGAGDVGVRVITLTNDQARTVKQSERVLLRWKFDLTQEDATIEFSILKSNCESPADRKKADYLIKDRHVQAGAAGENENAFAIQNACTLVWSNVKSWIRPKTVKFTVEAVVVSY